MIPRFLVCLVASACMLTACGGDEPDRSARTTTAAACSPEEAQSIDPRSSQHLLPGGAEPAYTTDPPTSGAHAPGNHPTGVLAAPLSKPVQVALLEGGEVLIQYRKAVDAATLAELVVPGNHITVAPNASLPSPVVATAWLFMQRCERVDAAALTAFVARHAGKTEGH